MLKKLQIKIDNETADILNNKLAPTVAKTLFVNLAIKAFAKNEGAKILLKTENIEDSKIINEKKE